MEIKAGYKQTEVGIIPEDWDIKPLQDIGQFDIDNLKASTRPDYEFNYISLEDIDEGTLNGYTEIKYRSAILHPVKVEA